MKFLKFTSVFILVFLAFSCKKEKNNTEEESAVCRISEITTNNDLTTKTTLKYDSIGRISEVEGLNTKYVFSYTGLTGKIEIIDRGIASLNPVNLTFDATGRLTSLRFVSGGLTHFCMFKYSADGYLITNEQTASNSTNTFSSIDSLIYTNGNLTQKIRKNGANVVINTVNYSYGTLVNKSYNFYWNELSAPFDFLGNIYIVYTLLGKPSRNLPTEISSKLSGFDQKYEFDYLINSDGYVAEYNSTYASTFGPTVDNIKLTQICP
jgi:hypothetical protein